MNQIEGMAFRSRSKGAVGAVLLLVILLVGACDGPLDTGGETAWDPGNGEPPPSDSTPVLTWDGEHFHLDEQPISRFGLRAANALQSDEITDRLIDALEPMREHGIQSIAVSLQGGRAEEGGNSRMNAFTPHGDLILEYSDRLARLLDATAQHEIVPVVMLFYRGRDQELVDADAVRRATEATIEFLRPWRHAWMHLVNEWYHGGFDHPILRGSGGQRELYELVKSIDPDRVTHVSDAGGANDGMRSDTGRRESRGGIVVEYRRQDTYLEPGVFTEGERTQARDDALATFDSGGYWFWHSAWHQKADAEGWPRWDAGGQGTAQDPGVSFVWELLRELSGR